MSLSLCVYTLRCAWKKRTVSIACARVCVYRLWSDAEYAHGGTGSAHTSHKTFYTHWCNRWWTTHRLNNENHRHFNRLANSLSFSPLLQRAKRAVMFPRFQSQELSIILWNSITNLIVTSCREANIPHSTTAYTVNDQNSWMGGKWHADCLW